MPRDLSADQTASLYVRHRVVVPLVEMDFLSGFLRVTTAPWNVTAFGVEFTGFGSMMSLEQRAEAVGSLEGLEITLSGLDTAAMTIAMSEPYRGRILKLYKAFLDSDSHKVIGNPVLQFVGRISAIPTSENNATATITIQAEHYDAELQRPAPRRFNDADQQRRYPGDRGAEFVEELAEKRIVWPSKEAQRQ